MLKANPQPYWQTLFLSSIFGQSVVNWECMERSEIGLDNVVICETSLVTLHHKVIHYVGHGWATEGSVKTIATTAPGKFLYAQMMVCRKLNGS
jgi:hypothetical protein